MSVFSNKKLFQGFILKDPYLNSTIQKIIGYRYIFFLMFVFIIWVDKFIYTKNILVGIYSLLMIFLGVVFSTRWQGLFQSLLITFCRFSFLPSGIPGIDEFFFQWFSYFAIWLAVSSLVKKNIEQNENLIRFTTAFVRTLDSRDKYTASHSDNVARYSLLIAKELGLTEKKCNEIKLGALMHDIGKIGIPENILNKSTRLTEQEYEIIKSHTVLGHNMVKDISIYEKIGILDAILYHHEREDGTGYPTGLKGMDIPLTAKIIAVADSFDAMLSKRVYKTGKGFDNAVDEIITNKGNWYDTEVVEAFKRIIDREGENILVKTEVNSLK